MLNFPTQIRDLFFNLPKCISRKRIQSVVIAQHICNINMRVRTFILYTLYFVIFFVVFSLDNVDVDVPLDL